MMLLDLTVKVNHYNRKASIIGAINMITKEVTVTNSVGLHARPATYFIQKANTYKSSIMIERGERRANAKSLLGVLSLGIVKGTVVNLIADGVDEADAIDGLSTLILKGFID